MKQMKKIVSLILALALMVSCIPVTAYAIEMSEKPADGVTYEQPFAAGTGGSQKFRIPCLVTLDDGTIVGGCDARWNGGADAGGVDTIVSRSTDMGATWNYTFANYLGDNGNVFNNKSTTFIDPAMATDGETVYMIADLYPAGYAINSAANYATNGDGFDANGNVRLSDNSRSSYDYYLEQVEGAADDSESYYVIKDNATNTVVDGYTVDAFFNIKGEDVDTNLFCEDSPFELLPTDYLYLTTSTDGGATWSIPYLINVKHTEEQSLLVGPGRGLVTSTGRIIFTVYDYSWGDKFSACIYSDDGGKTWTRGADVSSQSSEATVVEADGRLYMFTRHGGYYVSEDWGATWGPRIEPGITYISTCQLSAITYSEKIDGKTAILLSAPSNTGSRSAGKIFVGLVQDDKSIDWAYEYSVNGSAYYAYSCLSELSDGSMGLLYESAGTAITWTNIAMEDIAEGGAIGDIWCEADEDFVSEVVLKPNASKAVTIGGETGPYTAVSADESVVTVQVDGSTLTVTAQNVTGLGQAEVTVTNGTASYTFLVTVTQEENYEIVDLRMGDTKVYADETGNYQDADLTGVDSAIAEVQVVGVNEAHPEGMVQGQLATAVATFDGAYVDMSDCAYTFTSTGTENQYVISATTEDGTTVYLHPYTSSVAQIPNVTTSGNVTVASYSETDGTFSLFDGTGYLYFYKNNTANLYFDRQKSNGSGIDFELYVQSESAPCDSPIYGYQKVTSLSDIESGSQYLIVSVAADGNYYVLRPMSSGSNYQHVAKVTKDVCTSSTTVWSATDIATFMNSISFEDCEYTFAATETDNTYTISATTAEDETVYLHHREGSVPNSTNTSTITLAKNSNDATFSLQDNVGSGGSYLYFWKTQGDAANKFLRYDKNSSADANCYFILYKKTEGAIGSEIKGYTQVTTLSEVTAGDAYLIATVVDGYTYLLYPTTSTDQFAHVAKVMPATYQTVGQASTTITFTGVTEGTTSINIGDVTYFVRVKNDVKNIELEIGDVYVATGTLKQSVEGQDVVTLEQNTTLPPYAAVSEITSGKYLIAYNSYIATNGSGTFQNANGLALKSVNFDKDELSAYMWTVTKTASGYTIQDAEERYVNMNTSDSTIAMSDTEQVLQINANGSQFDITNGSRYFNNWGNGGTIAAGWTANNNTWSFYQPAEGIVITGLKVGDTSIIVDGTTYKIHVVCAHECEEWTNTQAATCMEAGLYTGTCTLCKETFTETVAALGHAWDDGEITTQATCMTEGVRTYTCKNDKTHTKTEAIEIDKTAHTYGEWTTKTLATCEAAEVQERACTVEGCTYSETQTVGESLGHKLEVRDAKEATCTEEGYTGDKWCTVCNIKVEQGSVVEEKGHTEVIDEAVAPTCTTDGKTAGSHCSVCDAVLVEQEVVKATGHSCKTTTKAATTKADGSKVEKCTTCGEEVTTTTINQIKSVTLSKSSYKYNGKAQKPSVVVKDSKGNKILSANYTVKYASGCKKVGKYKVTITFKGDYTGTVTRYFTINPKATKLTKATAGKKAISLKWNKLTKEVDGYQIQYATNKSFTKGKKVVTVKKAKTTTLTLKKLSAKKTYYVRIRTYKKVSGKTYYSAWSAVKTVKTK